MDKGVEDLFISIPFFFKLMWQKKLKSVKPQTFETRLGGLKIYILWLIISRRFG